MAVAFAASAEFRFALATASLCDRPGWGSALRLALATRRHFARALCFDLTAHCLRAALGTTKGKRSSGPSNG